MYKSCIDRALVHRIRRVVFPYHFHHSKGICTLVFRNIGNLVLLAVHLPLHLPVQWMQWLRRLPGNTKSGQKTFLSRSFNKFSLKFHIKLWQNCEEINTLLHSLITSSFWSFSFQLKLLISVRYIFIIICIYYIKSTHR